MNWTENDAADLFFAEFLLPLRQANRRARIDYLDRRFGQPGRGWESVVTRTGGLAQIGAAATDAACLLAELGPYWQRHGEERLPVLLPSLEALRHRLKAGGAAAPPASPSLPDYIYPMF